MLHLNSTTLQVALRPLVLLKASKLNMFFYFLYAIEMYLSTDIFRLRFQTSLPNFYNYFIQATLFSFEYNELV